MPAYEPQAGRSTAPQPAPTSITTKAQRLVETARNVRDMAHRVRAACVRPGEKLESAGVNVSQPPLDHAVFALEEAQNTLDAVAQLLSDALEAL